MQLEPQRERIKPEPEEILVSVEPVQEQAPVVLPKREVKSPEAAPSFEEQAREQAHRELAEMAKRRDEARAAAAQVITGVSESLQVIEATNLAPEQDIKLSEVQEDDVDELMEREDVATEFYPYVYEGLKNEEPIGEGLESRVSRGIDAFTGQKVLKYEAKSGMGDYLLNHAKHLQKLSHKTGFLKLIYLSEEGDKTFMLCADPGTVPVDEVLPKLPLVQKIDLVKQLADRLKTLHLEGVLHRDLRPDQVYVSRKEDGSFELYLADFGVAAKMGENGEMECSIEDPTHARAVSHFKAVFASADVAEGLPFDAQAEIEVFSKVGAYLLTGLVPSRGVEVGLRKIKPEAKAEKIKHCLSTAAAEREDRYHSMSEFCYDMNARQPMTPEERKALHAIQDAFNIGPLEKDLDALAAQVKILGEGEIQLAAEPLKEFRRMMLLAHAGLTSVTDKGRRKVLERLDAALAQTIGALEKDELGIIQELESIGKEREREFNQEENVSHGDEIILAFMDHPSDRVRAAAIQASSLTHRGRKLIPCTDRVIAKAREVLIGSRTTEHPDEWKSLWGWCTLERSEIGRGFLTGDDMKDKTTEKDLFIRMVGEDVEHKDRVFSTLKASVYYFSTDDVIKISSVAVEKLQSLQQASLEGKIIHEDHEMANAHSWSFGLYGVLRDMVENLTDYSVMEEEKDKQMILKAQQGIVDFLLQYRHSQSSYFREKLSTPFWFQGHPGSNSEMTKEWDPTQISRLMNGIAEAPECSIFTCTTWIPTNLLRHGHINAEVAVKVLRRLIKDGQKLTDFDCGILESAYGSGKEGAATCVAEFLMENMTDPEVRRMLEGRRMSGIVTSKVVKHLAYLRDEGRQKPDSDPEVMKAFECIASCLRNNNTVKRDLGERDMVAAYLQFGRTSAGVDLALDVLEFDGEFLTKLMNDVFEAAKKDPEVKNEYKFLPWKNRGRKYFIEGTKYDDLLAKLADKIHDEWTKSLKRPGTDEEYPIHPPYSQGLVTLAGSIYQQLGNKDEGTFGPKTRSLFGG